MDVQSSKATKSEKNNTNINISTHTCDLHVSAKKGGSFKVQLPVSQTAPADECRCEVPMNTDTKRRKKKKKKKNLWVVEVSSFRLNTFSIS